MAKTKVPKGQGDRGVAINSDGSWNFSGQIDKDTRLDNDEFNIAFAVKSFEGTVVVFKHAATIKQEDPQS